MIKAAVLTISDSCSAGTRQDQSGPAVKDMLISTNIDVGEILLLPDDQDQIAARLKSLCDDTDIDIIITTGGTGFGPRDVTPEATLDVCDRMAPGLMEVVRAESYKKTPKAVLSRGCAGIRNGTLIINLPGSVKAVTECMQIIGPILPHAVKMMQGGGHD
ncbi:MAG: MogA/MoaB family molybdenum cofactor biosynthesis protein [Planctomycetes bacterium]|nr:MogA/MoaB family molybdenum cofactor biosynthesis protein [Planctomycetota bacterium]